MSGRDLILVIFLVALVSWVFIAFGGAISTKIKGMMNTGVEPKSDYQPPVRPPAQKPGGKKDDL